MSNIGNKQVKKWIFRNAGATRKISNRTFTLEELQKNI
ncbi:hypothetical protein KOY_02895 [Bacillus cereus VDM021]|nr:hypothetical protein IIW_02001 [Bacillus cereus VD136]EOP68458.1 hypothetical protein KOW_03667 [Bacillus cereus VDM006]EOQ05109.1 hypothetical protein KOY_02895 [Bacillus cereus VDM021]OOG94106.1 hypothetical protein BTH41_01805 [Bacillus mycoides]